MDRQSPEYLQYYAVYNEMSLDELYNLAYERGLSVKDKINKQSLVTMLSSLDHDVNTLITKDLNTLEKGTLINLVLLFKFAIDKEEIIDAPKSQLVDILKLYRNGSLLPVDFTKDGLLIAHYVLSKCTIYDA